MGVPTTGDFNKWTGTRKFNQTDWDQNVDKTVEILANGNYDLNVAQITATNYVGVPSDQFSTLTAGENLSAGDVLRISGGQLFKADNGSEAGITDVVGVCNTTVSSGGTVKVDYGFFDGFSSLVVGTTYYVGTSGALTSSKPASNALVIGVAVSTTRINFEFSASRELDNNQIDVASASIDKITNDLILEDATPSLTLNDTGSGASQKQEINFDTADGNFAQIYAETTDTARGLLYLRSYDTDGYNTRASFGRETKMLANTMFYTMHAKAVTGSYSDFLSMQVNSGGYTSWFVDVIMFPESGDVKSRRQMFAVRSYDSAVDDVINVNIHTTATPNLLLITSTSGGVITWRMASAANTTVRAVFKIYSGSSITYTYH